MKTKIIILLLIFGTIFAGCDFEKKVPTASDLHVYGVKTGTAPSGENIDLIFTGDDIVSFDVFNGALGGCFVFANDKINEIMTHVDLYTELKFFIGDKPVFDPPIRIYRGNGFSYDDFDLQFRYDGFSVILTDAYMILDSVPVGERGAKQKEIAANQKKRKAELDILIYYLSDARKIVRGSEFSPPKNSGCDIFAFTDSDHFVNWKIKGTNITADYIPGTDMRTIAPCIIVSERASVSPKSGEKIDFSNMKSYTYTVTAENGTQKVYRAQAMTRMSAYYVPKESLPEWLVSMIDNEIEVINLLPYTWIPIFQLEWRNRTMYEIVTISGYCPVYYDDGTKVVWTDEDLRSFHTESINRVLIYLKCCMCEFLNY